jgi:hypothetical protein
MGEVGHLLLLDRDGRDRSEGSDAHPMRVLPSVEIDLPGGGAMAAETGNLELET